RFSCPRLSPRQIATPSPWPSVQTALTPSVRQQGAGITRSRPPVAVDTRDDHQQADAPTACRFSGVHTLTSDSSGSSKPSGSTPTTRYPLSDHPPWTLYVDVIATSSVRLRSR